MIHPNVQNANSIAESQVFKILTESDWTEASRSGAFAGSSDDIRDGFIHLSAARQLAGTLAKHFRDRADLILVAYRTTSLGPALRWEPSRGGDYFPHLYAPLPTAAAIWQRPLQLGPDGIAILDEGWFQC